MRKLYARYNVGTVEFFLPLEHVMLSEHSHVPAYNALQEASQLSRHKAWL